MMDSKALEKLGLTEKDFQPKEQPQEERIEDLEKALLILMGGENDAET